MTARSLHGRLRARSAGIAAEVARALAEDPRCGIDLDDDEHAHLRHTVEAAVAVSIDVLGAGGVPPADLLRRCRDLADVAARRRRPRTQVLAFPERVAMAVVTDLWNEAHPGEHGELAVYTRQVYSLVTAVQAEMEAAFADARQDGTAATPPAGPPAGGPAVRYLDVLERRVRRDRAAAESLRRVMAPLLGDAVLIDTLRCLYLHDLDRARTASELGIARRTLTYRLDRIESLTGLPPTATRAVQVLGLGLAAVPPTPGAPPDPPGTGPRDP